MTLDRKIIIKKASSHVQNARDEVTTIISYCLDSSTSFFQIFLLC